MGRFLDVMGDRRTAFHGFVSREVRMWWLQGGVLQDFLLATPFESDDGWYKYFGEVVKESIVSPSSGQALGVLVFTFLHSQTTLMIYDFHRCCPCVCGTCWHQLALDGYGRQSCIRKSRGSLAETRTGATIKYEKIYIYVNINSQMCCTMQNMNTRLHC